MFGDKTDRLGQVLTEEQLIMVGRIISCKTGYRMRVNALKEYYNRPEIAEALEQKGWNPDALAYSTITNHDRHRDTQED